MSVRASLSACLAVLACILSIPIPAGGKTIYVDDDAAGANDGTSWGDAYRHLQDALAGASSGDEIRVAQGTYTPDKGVGFTRGDRTASFQPRAGVTINGGYAGVSDPEPNWRDIGLYRTVLCGDLNGDDGPEFSNTSDNSLHVITYVHISVEGSALDGLTIRGGCAGDGAVQEGSDGAVQEGKGGAIYSYSTGGVAVVRNCVFTGNFADLNGGAVYSRYAMQLFVSCLFTGNASDRGCGGIAGGHRIVNCTFAGNRSSFGGCAVSGSTRISNSIFWGNKDAATKGPVVSLCDGDFEVSYSCVQDSDPNDDSVYPGIGNTDDDPQFVDLYGADMIMGTGDEDLRLAPNSPCMDSGDHSAIPTWLVTDLDGEPRIGEGVVDMGAYEGPHQGILLSTRSLTVRESESAGFTVALAMDPGRSVEVTIVRASGDSDVAIASGALLSFDSSNFSLPQNVILSAADDDDYFNGTALIEIGSPEICTTGFTAIEWDDDVPSVLCVDQNACGANNGTSWADALTDLQEALGVAAVQPQVEEIHVAEGTYHPCGPGGDREVSFDLLNGFVLYGGFPSGGGSPAERDPNAYETILSGESSNAYHVVTAVDCDANTVFDGFTICGGNANGRSSPQGRGGGMYISEAGPVINNCVFRNNSAVQGGGMWIGQGGPKLTNCDFIGNHADYSGGMANGSKDTILTNCRFIGNFATLGGGGTICNDATLNYCTFVRNRTGGDGSAIWNHCEHPVLNHCLFVENSVDEESAALLNYEGGFIASHCIFWGNNGASISDDEGDSVYSHCIIRDSAYLDEDSSVVVNYSNIKGGWPGVGNIDADPLFADPENGDYHLKSQAGRWDANDGRWTMDEVTSACIDAGDPMSPVGLEGFPNGGVVNMGAYGGTVEASKSYFGGPVCEIIVAGDINGDCIIDFRDFVIMGLHWCEDNN